jgi:hypothetical protein
MWKQFSCKHYVISNTTKAKRGFVDPQSALATFYLGPTRRSTGRLAQSTLEGTGKLENLGGRDHLKDPDVSRRTTLN